MQRTDWLFAARLAHKAGAKALPERGIKKFDLRSRGDAKATSKASVSGKAFLPTVFCCAAAWIAFCVHKHAQLTPKGV